MATEADPIVENWYRNLAERQNFEVVAVDNDEGTIEIQYFGGEVEEIDFDTWYEMELVTIEPPEDWSGPFDDLERDDLGYSDGVMRPENWSGALGGVEPED